jgi:hypothetical protein
LILDPSLGLGATPHQVIFDVESNFALLVEEKEKNQPKFKLGSCAPPLNYSWLGASCKKTLKKNPNLSLGFSPPLVELLLAPKVVWHKLHQKKTINMEIVQKLVLIAPPPPPPPPQATHKKT